jgi:hypothetical protein
MWKLWNKSEPVIGNGQTTDEIVQEIHNMFNSAADNALQEACEIIAQDNPVGDYISTLEGLGFTAVGSVVQTKEQRQKIGIVRKQVDVISYMQQAYP